MALTRRGFTVTALVVMLVLVGVVGGVLFLGGKAGVGPFAAEDTSANHGGGERPTPPAKCPLTGIDPKGDVPSRPALAIKVENLPQARPQTGLSYADVIYEEPVEAGITRFIVVYQCQDSSKVEPVRSARLTDPGILVQYGKPLFGYSGAVPQVIEKVRQAGLIDVNADREPKAYHRDPARQPPHDLYTSTPELYAAAKWRAQAPEPVFLYSGTAGKGKKISEAHLPFSEFSDVYWRWDQSQRVWLRFHGTEPHTYSDGSQVNAKNVIVQVVTVVMTDITDVNGVHSPEVVDTGSGEAYILRNGKLISGTWKRPTTGDLTTFVTASGNQIRLSPGNTWVELLPSEIAPTFT
jgi:hypothetical protein